MKKQAQQPAPLAGISNIYMKRQELQKSINDTLGQFKQILDTTQKQMTDQVTKQMNDLAQKLQTDVEKKLNEMQRLMPKQTTQQPMQADDRAISSRAYFQGGGGVNEPAPKKRKYKGDTPEHPTARGDGEKTPEFWKKNFDYGEGPYTNLDKKMKDKKTITDYEHTMFDDGRYKKRKKNKKTRII